MLLLCISIEGEGETERKDFTTDFTTETSGSYWLSPHDQEAFAPIRVRDDIVLTETRLGAGHWSWHWMLPAIPEGLPEGLH